MSSNCMQEFVDQVYTTYLRSCQDLGIKVEPVKLRAGVQRHLADALSVITLSQLQSMGVKNLVFIMDTAGRHNLLLGEVLRESINVGTERLETLCCELSTRKSSISRQKSKPSLRLVK